MHTGFQPTAYFTQAQITAGDAHNLPGVRIIVVDASGAATGMVMEGGPAAPATTQTSGNSPRNNFAATTDPTVNDDSADGYSVGSHWINTATSESFICLNATVGAAVWELSTADILADIAGLQAALNSKQDTATAATDAELSAHTGSVSNPHAVTKAQVGLGNAENTADSAKPLSVDALQALYSDNLIFNSGADRANINGWVPVEGTPTFSASTTDRQRGDASFLLSHAAGVGGAVGFRAIPVQPGEKYYISVDVRSDVASAAGFYFRAQQKAAYPATGDHITISNRDTISDIIANGPTTVAWERKTATYIVPANVYWVTFSIYKWTSSTAAQLFFDNYEVRKILPAAGVDIVHATTSLAGLMSTADKTKLDGVATGATLNATDAQLRDRTTHTGAQAISTVTSLQVALDAKAALNAAVHFESVSTTKVKNLSSLTNIDNHTDTGFFDVNRPTGALPEVGVADFWYRLVSQKHSDNSTGWSSQFAQMWYNNGTAYDGRWFYRTRSNGTWSAWRKLVSSESEYTFSGTTGGLNAETAPGLDLAMTISRERIKITLWVQRSDGLWFDVAGNYNGGVQTYFRENSPAAGTMRFNIWVADANFESRAYRLKAYVD